MVNKRPDIFNPISTPMLGSAKVNRFMLIVIIAAMNGLCLVSDSSGQQGVSKLEWRELPPLPDELGLAGPIVGVHDDILLAGGGANFARPVWEHNKQWHRNLYALDLRASNPAWRVVEPLDDACGYAACASTDRGIVCCGGNNDGGELRRCWLLRPMRDAQGGLSARRYRLPDLPVPLSGGQAVWTGQCVLVVTGQTSPELSSATASGWQLDLPMDSRLESWATDDKAGWRPIPDCPGGPRSYAMMAITDRSSIAERTSAKTSGVVLLFGGRKQTGSHVQYLNDVWQYDVDARQWTERTSMPGPLAAGGAVALDARYVVVLSGDDGRLVSQTDQLRDAHPGFPNRTWIFDSMANTWASGGSSPANQVATTPVRWRDKCILVSGELRPRVRTNRVWEISSRPPTAEKE